MKRSIITSYMIRYLALILTGLMHRCHDSEEGLLYKCTAYIRKHNYGARNDINYGENYH